MTGAQPSLRSQLQCPANVHTASPGSNGDLAAYRAMYDRTGNPPSLPGIFPDEMTELPYPFEPRARRVGIFVTFTSAGAASAAASISTLAFATAGLRPNPIFRASVDRLAA